MKTSERVSYFEINDSCPAVRELLSATAHVSVLQLQAKIMEKRDWILFGVFDISLRKSTKILMMHDDASAKQNFWMRG